MADPPRAQKRAYLDCNAGSPVVPAAVEAMVRWCGVTGDPAAAHAGAREARQMMDDFRRWVAAEGGFGLDGPDGYAVVFTSGGAESNCAVVTSAVRAYTARTGRLPHVVVGAAEHPSLLGCCDRLAAEGFCQLTVLPVGRAAPSAAGGPPGAPLGAVAPADLAAALRPNTCLVSVQAANGDTGTLNDLRALAAAARRARVPFHTDAAQLFGRAPFRPRALGVDAFSACLGTLGAPPGVGLLVLRRAFIEGYGLGAHICGGGQNEGLRGGPENVPGIGAASAACRLAAEDRPTKTARLARLRDAAKEAIATRLPCFPVGEHPADPPPSPDGGITPGGPPSSRGTPAARRAIAAAEAGGPAVVFWVAPADPARALPNTLLLAVRRPGFCAEAARAALERRGVIVGLVARPPEAAPAVPGRRSLAPAAQQTVVEAAAVPAALRAGVLRVSLGDATSGEDIGAFVRAFLTVVASGECLSAPGRGCAQRARRDKN